MAWQSWFYAKHPVVIPMHLAGSVGTIAITAFVLGTLVGGCLPGVLVLVRHLLEQSQYLAWLAPLQMYLLVVLFPPSRVRSDGLLESYSPTI